METPGISDLSNLWEEVSRSVTGPYRNRVLTYGPDAARMLLRFFDETGLWITKHDRNEKM